MADSLSEFCFRRNYTELKDSDGWKLVPQALYKDVLDAILPVSTESVVNLTSKITIATAQLNATVNSAGP